MSGTNKVSSALIFRTPLGVAGFTLVELMVCVAIVGILSSVAIPSYRHFSAKARQTEAKVALGGIYTSELSFSVEQSSYTTCLREAGYVPSGSQRYYLSGFYNPFGCSDQDTICGPGTGQYCYTYDFSGGGSTCSAWTHSGCTSWTGSFCVDNVMIDSFGSDTTFFANASAEPGALVGIGNPLFTTLYGVCWYPSANTFLAGAAGSVYPSANYFDLWTMDENKNLTNIISGI